MLASITPEDGLQVLGGVDPGPDVDMLAQTIPALRLLAADHPELTGLVLDDFHGSLRRWDRPSRSFGPEELAELRTLATDTACADPYCAAPSIALWPYSTARELLYVAVPGLELGLPQCTGACDRNADHRLYPAADGYTADAIGASLSWVAESDAPDVTLRFVFDDLFSGRDTAIADLVVRRDDDELGRFVLNNDQEAVAPGQAAGMRSVVVALPMEAGEAVEVELVLEARSAEVPEQEPRQVRVWGLELWNDEDILPVDLLSDSMVGLVARRDTRREGLSIALSGLAVLEHTSESHISDHVDAVLVHDLEPSARWFDMEVHRHIVGAACRSLRSQGLACHATQWGNDQWRVDLDADLQAERVEVARESADGVVIYRHALDLVGGQRGEDGVFVPPAHGIYAEVLPHDPVGYDIGATWPGYTGGVPGYIRRWEQMVDCAGDWTVSWSRRGGANRFDVRVGQLGDDGDELAFEGDVGDTPATGTTLLSLQAGDTVVVELAGKASIGNATYGLDARLEAPETCGGARATDWTTSSAVDPELADLFEAVDAVLVAGD